MSLMSRLVPQLPYVRRYSRALIGDQVTGDHYVRATLEALVVGEQFLDGSVDPRVALYKIFHVIWDSTGNKLVDLPEADEGDVSPARKMLRRISPRSRQAYLLTTVEGFTAAETAQILEDDIASIEGLVAEAQREIDAEPPVDIGIIEDEPMIAAHIELIVEDLGHRVMFIATTRSEVEACVKRAMPRLILSDVHLADGSSGIDAVKDILRDHDLPVIFVTAFPERLLTGERPEPTYLVTKPFEPETLKAAIGQALLFHSDRTRTVSRGRLEDF